MEDFEQFEARMAERSRVIAANGCTLGDARICIFSGYREPCRHCGWRAGEIERRKRLPMFRNDKGLWGEEGRRQDAVTRFCRSRLPKRRGMGCRNTSRRRR